MVFASIQTADLVARCLAPLGALDGAACDRVAAYVGELVRYNERTNIYAQSSYEHLPFHVLDSVTLGLAIAESATAAASGVLQADSGRARRCRRPHTLMERGSGATRGGGRAPRLLGRCRRLRHAPRRART